MERGPIIRLSCALVAALAMLIVACAHRGEPNSAKDELPVVEAAWYDRIETENPHVGDFVRGYEYLEAFTAEELAPPIAREVAFKVLAKTPDFCGTRVGYGNDTPIQVHCFETLLRLEDAREVFGALLKRATLPGRLYALCGLYVVDRAAFDAVVGPFRRSQEKLLAGLGGCIWEDVPVGDIVMDIENGTWPDEFAKEARSLGTERLQ